MYDEFTKAHMPKPSYYYKVGDKVHIGNLDNAVIVEILDNGTAYKIKYDIIRENPNPRKPNVYGLENVRTWYDIGLNSDIDKVFASSYRPPHYTNRMLEDLLMGCLRHGVDMDAFYQRPLVWNKKQKESLIESVFNSVEIGRFLVRKLPWKNISSPSKEIVDGKQRLSTLIDYRLSRFSYRGVFYNNLSKKDMQHFEGFQVSVAELNENTDDREVLQHFLKTNIEGTPQDPKHLQEIREYYNRKYKGE